MSIVENTMDNRKKSKTRGYSSHEEVKSATTTCAESGIADARARRLAGARKGGNRSAALRREQAERLDAFRTTLIARLKAPDAVSLALVDVACSLYLPLLRRSKASLTVNAKVNLLALSAGATSLRSVLKDLGALGTNSEASATQTLADIRAEYIQKARHE